MRYAFLLAAGISLFACNTPSTNNTDNQQKKGQTSGAITPGQLLDRDFILDFAGKNGKGKNAASDKYFLEGVDAYRNKKDPAKGETLFRQSIMARPQARAYFELGNVLADQDKLAEAAAAYQIAEGLDYKPTSKVLYNLACVYSRANDSRSSRYYLVSAIEFGYSNMKSINTDKDLANLRALDGYEFKSYTTAALSGATDPDKLQWNLFWHEFKPVHYPLVLDEPYREKLGEEISYEYERFVAEMRDNAKFSREVGYEFFHVGLAKTTDSVKTLIYAVQDVVWEDDDRSYPAYYIVSFDQYGKLIDKLMIGGHRILSEPFRVATLTQNGNIEVELFKKVYEKDPEKYGYDENKLLDNKFLETEYYVITEDGHFVKKDQLLGMNL